MGPLGRVGRPGGLLETGQDLIAELERVREIIQTERAGGDVRVDEDDLDRRPAKRLRGRQPPEPRADDHHPRNGARGGW